MSKQSDAEKLAAILGIEPPPPSSTIYDSEEEISRQAEATLAYFKDASYFNRKHCTICNRVFAHTYGQVAYCSNICRAAALEKIGIKWEWVVNAGKQWNYNYAEPLVVPPDALELLDGLPDVHPETPPEAPQRPVPALSQDVFDILKGLGLE